MKTETDRNTEALSDIECRAIIAIKLYQKKHRVGPPWSWIRQQTGISRYQIGPLMRYMRRHQYVGFSREPGSTYASKHGVERAMATLKKRGRV